MLVEASIDGRPVTLLVDTGANKTILNARSIGRMQLPVSQPVTQGAGIIGNARRLRVDIEIAHQRRFVNLLLAHSPLPLIILEPSITKRASR